MKVLLVVLYVKVVKLMTATNAARLFVFLVTVPARDLPGGHFDSDHRKAGRAPWEGAASNKEQPQHPL